MNFIRLIVLLQSCFLLCACGDPPLIEAEFFVFGTLVQVSVAGADENQSELAFSRLQDRFQTMHRDWHAWEPGKLSEINRAFTAGEWVAADPDIIELVKHSQQIESKTGGRFNSAIGGLVSLWGFHTSDYPIQGPAPSQSDIDTWVSQHPASTDIQVKDGLLHSTNRSVQLDFGGIAKGYAVDLACAILKEVGIQNAIVNAGGDLRAFGVRGMRPWRIAIQNPIGGVLGGIEILYDEAVFTSGNYERFRETSDGARFAHILDPRTGWPARQVMSATVISDVGWRADAAATAFIVAGLSDWAELAEALEIELVLLTDESGQVYATPEMLNRLDLNETITPVILTSSD